MWKQKKSLGCSHIFRPKKQTDLQVSEKSERDKNITGRYELIYQTTTEVQEVYCERCLLIKKL